MHGVLVVSLCMMESAGVDFAFFFSSHGPPVLGPTVDLSTGCQNNKGHHQWQSLRNVTTELCRIGAVRWPLLHQEVLSVLR